MYSESKNSRETETSEVVDLLDKNGRVIISELDGPLKPKMEAAEEVYGDDVIFAYQAFDGIVARIET